MQARTKKTEPPNTELTLHITMNLHNKMDTIFQHCAHLLMLCQCHSYCEWYWQSNL